MNKRLFNCINSEHEQYVVGGDSDYEAILERITTAMLQMAHERDGCESKPRHQ